jgi:hypothetical protein
MTAHSQVAILNAKEQNISVAIKKVNTMEMEYGK